VKEFTPVSERQAHPKHSHGYVYLEAAKSSIWCLHASLGGGFNPSEKY